MNFIEDMWAELIREVGHPRTGTWSHHAKTTQAKSIMEKHLNIAYGAGQRSIQATVEERVRTAQAISYEHGKATGYDQGYEARCKEQRTVSKEGPDAEEEAAPDVPGVQPVPDEGAD